MNSIRGGTLAYELRSYCENQALNRRDFAPLIIDEVKGRFRTSYLDGPADEGLKSRYRSLPCRPRPYRVCRDEDDLRRVKRNANHMALIGVRAAGDGVR